MTKGLSPENNQTAELLYTKHKDAATEIEHINDDQAEELIVLEGLKKGIRPSGAILSFGGDTQEIYQGWHDTKTQIAQDAHDANLYTSGRHYQDNQSEYKEQAVIDAAAVGIVIDAVDTNSLPAPTGLPVQNAPPTPNLG